MNKTNVYQASYDDLSELTINAMDMRSAVQGLKLVKEEEPQLLRRIMGNVITPNNTEVKVVAESTSMQPLPEGIVVVPTEGVFYENDVVTLYEVPVDRATFVGWYEDDKLLSSDPIFNYVIPGKNVTVVAKFDVEPLAVIRVPYKGAFLELGGSRSLLLRAAHCKVNGSLDFHCNLYFVTILWNDGHLVREVLGCEGLTDVAVNEHSVAAVRFSDRLKESPTPDESLAVRSN